MSIEDIYMHFDIPGLNDVESSNKLKNIFVSSTMDRIRKQKQKGK